MTNAEAAERGADPEKRAKILAGARDVFFAQGFAGASMDAIAKAAGVSKGTLYVYFENKESLFAALIEARRGKLPEAALRIEEGENIRESLERIAAHLAHYVVQPEHVAFVRMMIGAVEKFPHLGRMFYEAGPSFGNKRLGAFFKTQMDRDRLGRHDPSLAAQHFVDLTMAYVIRWVLVCDPGAMTDERISEVVRTGVDAFLRAYGPRST